MPARLFGFDLETFLMQPGLLAPRIVCGSWADETSEHIGTPEQTRHFFVETLERGDHLVGVNIAFDVVVMAAQWPELLPLIFRAGNAGQFHCCAVREALHDIAIDKLFTDYKTGKPFLKRDPETGEMSGRYSLKILMQRHFNTDISSEKEGDVWRFKYASLDGVPFEQWPAAAREYPKSDARRAYDVCKAQTKHRNKQDEAAQTRAAIAIQFMCAWAFRTDGEYLAKLDTDVDAIWNAARTEFAKAGIFRPDGTKDTKRLAEMVTAAFDGNPAETPTGKVCCDRDALEESGVDLLVKLGTSGKNDKRKTLYIPAMKRGIHAPINPEFNVLVNTGRVSSDFQQMPQKGGIRESVISRGYLSYLQTRKLPAPEQDTVIVSCDFGGLELRTMAQRAIFDPDVGFSKMADFINQGKDVHCYVGAYFLGCTYEEFVAKFKAKDPRYVAFRALAKIFNFGKGGGMGAGAMAYSARSKDGVRFCLLAGRATVCGVHKVDVRVQGKLKRVCALCVQIAKELGDKWLKAWPEQGLLFDKAGRLTSHKRKTDATVFGSNRVRGGCGYTQYLNTPFQGAGGDGCKAAMWRIAEESYTDRRSPLWGSRVFLNVHDELLGELPWLRRHDAAFRMATVMVETMNAITPDVKNEVVPAIMRRLFKYASDVYDSRKVLRPWWPIDAKQPWSWGPDQEVMAMDLAA